jgi:ABC-type multidrug transport system ATPase subunit/ABC-type multidrug transport system permease subunit/cellobiose-specific phosphotransferase system component IIB
MTEQKDKFIHIEPEKLIYTIGRSDDNDIYLNSPQVSRFHAQINVLNRKDIEIEDLDSKYGTLVNGRRILRQILRDKDKILIGIFEFLVQINPEGAYLKFPTKKPESNFVAEYDLLRHTSLLIGRGTSCTISLDSQQVSRSHSRIEKAGNDFVILDLGSTNGTFVNGKRVEKKTLKNKDIIQVGPIRFLFADGKVYQLNEKDVVRIDVINVSKEILGTQVLRDVSLSVLPREFVGILGPSGAGKSMLLNIMNGNLLPDSGSVNLNNMDFNANYGSFKHIIGFVPQQDIIHPELSVLDTLSYAADLRLPEDMSQEEKKKRVDQVITTLELDERKSTPVHSLSGGQRKRVNLGVELLTEPSILFLDEPTSGLDPGLDQKMMQLFRRIADSGQTLIMATHDLNEIMLFDQVAIIFEGDLVYFGPPGDMNGYFKVEKPNDVYNRLYFPPEGGWVQRFKGSIYYKDYIMARLKMGKKPGEGEKPKPSGEGSPFDSMIFFNPAFSAFRQFKTLIRRYLHIISRDMVNVCILLGQAPIIAFLLILVFLNYRNVWSLLFCFSLSAVWFGCINSIREITKEKHIYARERVVSLKVGPYVFSKIAVLFMLCLVQCLVLMFMVSAFVKIEGSLIFMFWVIFISSLCGLSLGLMISALADTSDKAVGVLPIILIPQILFSGTVVEIDNMVPVSQGISNFMVLRWSYGLLKKISIWHKDFQWDNDLLVLLLFVPLFILGTLYFQKRKDLRH